MLTFFAGAFIIALSGAMMPGPLLTVTVAKVARKGFWQGPLIVFGHAILELVLVSLLLLGLRSALDSPAVIIAASGIGGLALILMGIDIVAEVSAGRIHLSLEAGSKREVASATLSGIITSLSNPYWTIWWLTIGAGYLAIASRSGTSGTVGFYFGHISGDLAWYTLVAAMVAKGRQYLSDRFFRSFLFACGVFMIVLGVYFAYSAITGI